LVIVVIDLCQSKEGVGIDAVVNIPPVYPDQDDLSPQVILAAGLEGTSSIRFFSSGAFALAVIVNKNDG
jgi:hypothetical protein